MEGTFKEPTLLNIFPLYCLSPHAILNRSRILEWVAIPFSRGSSLTQGLNLGLSHCRQISLSEPAGKCQSSLIILEWAVFPPISSEISAIKNGYFHGELSYYFIMSIHKTVACHHSSKEAHLHTQAHSLTSDPR